MVVCTEIENKKFWTEQELGFDLIAFVFKQVWPIKLLLNIVLFMQRRIGSQKKEKKTDKVEIIIIFT